MNKKTMKWVAVAVIFIGLAGGGYLYYQSKQTTGAPIGQTVKVERGKASSTVSATGTIKPVNSVEISSKITARIKEIPVKENDHVKQNQTLVILEDKELDTKLDQAQYKVTNAKAKYDRTAYLHSIGAKSDSELEDALYEYQNALSSLEGVQSNVDDTIIVSPIDGYVIGEPLSVGTLVAQGVNNPTVIMNIVDLSTKQIRAKVDETDIGNVKIGQSAVFTVDAYNGKTFTAKVANISQTDVNKSWSSSTTTSSSVIYYDVTLDVEDPDNLLKPSMTARVNINVAEKDHVLLVPLAALKTNNEGQYVERVNADGTTENVQVTVGIYSDDKVEITSGLAEGDMLAVSYTKSKNSSSSNGNRQHPPM